MARGRMLSTNVARDPELNALSCNAMLLYLMTIPHLDRDGMVDADPTLLWATVAPRRMDLLAAAPGLIDEWVSSGLVVRFGTKDGAALFFPGFQRHNAGIVYKREPPSRFPAPAGYVRTGVGLVPEDPETALEWAEAVNPKSEYYRALVEHAGAREELATTSRQPRAATSADDAEYMHSTRGLQATIDSGVRGVPAEYATPSRGVQVQPHSDDASAREDLATKIKSEVEVQINNVGVVALSSHQDHPGEGGECEGGVASGDAPANGAGSAGDILYAYTDHQLRTAAFELGAELGLQGEWAGFERWLANRSPGELAVLLEWEQFYRDMPQEGLERIKSLTALIRSNINKGSRAPLTGAQRRGLAEAIAHAVAVSEPYDP